MAAHNTQAIMDWIEKATRDRNIPFPGEGDSDVPLFWDLLHYDVREMIYKELLKGAGTRHHVTDSGQQRARPIMRTRCSDSAFMRSSTCGHQVCTRGRTESLQDLMSLMKTCKIAHLDVSDFVYRNITLVFEDFAVLNKFIHTTSPRYLSLIRRLGFIINAGDPDVYHDFQLVYASQRNALGLFRRFENLQHVEVNVYISYPDPILWPILDFSKIASAFSKTNIPNVLFRVPKPMWPDAAPLADNNNVDNDGNNVLAINVVGATTVTNSVIMFGGTGRGRQPAPQGLPDIPDNALEQYQDMTLIRPVFCKGETCKMYGEESRDGVHPWGVIDASAGGPHRPNGPVRQVLRALAMMEE